MALRYYKNTMSKVFVGMSGGVDSSVTAMMLKNEGHDVVGVFMRCYNVDGCQDRDAEDARRVAEHLQIAFYVWDFEEEYKKRVVRYMIEGYRDGITPNPDVMCNREIKFGLFFEKARLTGADYIATGHYVRLKENKLYQAVDKNKDQSYFLWTLTQKQLPYCLFPIGGYVKSEVRAMARKAGIPTAEKKDSQGICFLGKVTIEDFLKEYIPVKRGEIITTVGEKIGEHDGAYFYTIGQRHGLYPRGKNHALGMSGKQETKAHYVAAKDVATNTITVAEGSDHPALYKKEIELTDLNFISPLFSYSRELEMGGTRVFARVRYRQPLTPAVLMISRQSLVVRHKLIFEEAQRFVASGQSAVLYSEQEEMLGGGVIL